MMNRLLASPMHIVFCLRAREKVKVMTNSAGKTEFVPIGMQAIQEKNFTFEMTLSLLLDENTHLPTVTKCPEPPRPLLGDKQGLISKAMGEKLRAWTEAAAAASTIIDSESLMKQARDYAR
jgi:hypothetical protein